MSKLEIKNITYDNILIHQYKHIHKINDIDELVDFIYNKDKDFFDNLSMSEYSKYIKSLNTLKNYKIKKYDKLKLSDEYVLHYYNINNIKFGEYLDLIEYSKKNDIPKLMSIFYRFKIKDETIFDGPIFEDYTFDINIRSKIFQNISIKYYFNIKNDIEELSKVISTNFKEIFDDENNEIPETFNTKREEMEFIHNQKIKESFNQNAWQYTLYSLANGDVTKYPQILDTNLFVILNHLKLQRILEIKNKTK